jgi:glucose dehydrogenase
VEAWSHGGGAPWQTASFDIEKNMVVIGTGNPAPWNTWKRTKEGDDPRNWDSLFTSGQAYVDASTGELKGFFQHTPNDAWDFSGNNSVVLFEYKDPKTGKLVKASAHADRNGFFFVTDREKLATGAGYPNKPTSLIGAWPFVDGITWAKGFDLKTGKPKIVEWPASAHSPRKAPTRATASSSPRPSSAAPTGCPCPTARTPACSTSRPTTGRWTTGPRT